MERYPPAVGAREGVLLRAAFAYAAARYWLSVYPRAARELAGWRRRAESIPDPALRGLALAALAKRGNIEGAAAFAVFAPRSRRATATRALVALQSIYNYADMLAEQPSAEPVANGHSLHEALLAALAPAPGAGSDPYAHNPQREDGGYLPQMIAVARASVSELPSYNTVQGAAHAAAARILASQSLGLGESAPARERLARWAREEMGEGAPAGPAQLRWWESAAAAGSSLCLYALIAAAATPALEARQVEAIERAYHPWVGALHSLLDSFLDEAEDAEIHQLNLAGCYEDAADGAARMEEIAARAMAGARALPHGRTHAVAVAAMAGHYLSDISSSPEATPAATAAAAGVQSAIGGIARPILAMFALHRALARRAT